MSTFVLIHGAWHGAWCWYKVAPLLREKGHQVVMPDLPSHGRDKTPTASVSLQDYVDRVCEVLDAEDEPVILVGHSMGGVVISQTAEQRPDKISRLVYVAAFLLQDGQTLLDLAQPDADALVLPNLVFAEDQKSATVREEAWRETFFGDCSEADFALASSLLVAQPTAPFETPVRTSGQIGGRIPRIYIEAVQDRAISVSMQRRMYEALPCQEVLSMNTSHSPFFSAPEELAGHLTSL